MKVIIDNKIPFIRGAFEPYAEVVYLPGKDIGPDDVKDADAVITRTRTVCNESLLKDSSVKIVATATIGYDHIDTAWCEKNGILWCNAPGCNSRSVMQYISSVLVTLSARHSFDLSSMTLGVVGVGNVGSKVARLGEALGMKVLLNDPPRARKEGGEAFVGLDELQRDADIITIHVPLEKDGEDPTWHLFDADRISTLRTGQVLINSSRGPVVDNKALKAALAGNLLKAAVLDVWEGEPELDPGLVRLLDIATPHIAGYSADGKANGTSMSVRSVAARLGIKELMQWTPASVPAPTGVGNKAAPSLEFCVDARGKNTSEVLSEAILHCYDVNDDSLRLKSDLSVFERLRGDYQIRREPGAFSLKLLGAGKLTEERLKLIGFNLQ